MAINDISKTIWSIDNMVEIMQLSTNWRVQTCKQTSISTGNHDWNNIVKKSSITKQKQHAYETISHARVQKNPSGVRCCFLLINVFPRGLFGPPQGRIQGFWKGGSYVSRYEDSLCCFDINFLKYPMKMK